MKYFLLLASFVSSVLSANSDNIEIENYHLETDFYNDFITEIVGVYVLHELPPRIEDDIVEQTKLLKQYFFLKENPNAFKSKRALSKAELMKKILEIRNKNYRGEYRQYRSLISDIRKLENKLLKIDFQEDPFEVENYLDELGAQVDSLKRNYSNKNKQGEKFIQHFETEYYEPLLEYYENYSDFNAYVKRMSGLGDFRSKDISRLSMDEYKQRWNFFKEKKYEFLKSFFESKTADLKRIDPDKRFSISYDLANWYGYPYFVLQTKMFNQDWYVIVDPGYQSSRHEFSLIKM